jgi:hypothetical protein
MQDRESCCRRDGARASTAWSCRGSTDRTSGRRGRSRRPRDRSSSGKPMAEPSTTRGQLMPVVTQRRRSVCTTRVFSFARPKCITLSSASNCRRTCRVTSSLRWCWVKLTVSTPCAATRRSTAATNASVFGATPAVEARRRPKWPRRYHTTPPMRCNCGTQTLRYIRSMCPLSSTPCSRRTSRTLCGNFKSGSGHPRGHRTPLSFERVPLWDWPGRLDRSHLTPQHRPPRARPYHSSVGGAALSDLRRLPLSFTTSRRF